MGNIFLPVSHKKLISYPLNAKFIGVSLAHLPHLFQLKNGRSLHVNLYLCDTPGLHLPRFALTNVNVAQEVMGRGAWGLPKVLQIKFCY